MSPRVLLTLMVGIGLAVGVFLIMVLLLMVARGADFLTPTALSLVGVGSVLVVARPAWAISGRILPPSEGPE